MVRELAKRLLVKGQGVGEWIRFCLLGRPEAWSAILLAGSGRSGTTWLANVVAANPGIQQVFEPLNPVWTWEVRRLTGWDTKRLCPRSYYLRASDDRPEWKRFLNKALTGQVRSFWTDYERTSYFPARFLVKSIRANLMLGYIYDNFQPRIVYVTRHPCAVVHSRLALGWQASVADILRQEALVEDYLHHWVRHLEGVRDHLEAHAVWWAVENLIASQDLATRPHCPVTYEALCLRPEREVIRILAWLGIERPRKLDSILARPSRQSRPGASYSSTADRLSSWKRQLSPEEQNRILDWPRRLGVDSYDEHILPKAIQSWDVEIEGNAFL